MWCSILEHYYDLKYAGRFEELFGHTSIGQQPTAAHKQYFTLSLDFSPIEVGHSLGDLEHNFKQQTNNLLNLLRVKYPEKLAHLPPMKFGGESNYL